MSSKKEKWTVRQISEQTINRIAEVSEESGYTYGELLDQAVEDWYDHLPCEDDEALFAEAA